MKLMEPPASPSRRDSVSVLNRNIIVEGCTFTHTGLLFNQVDEQSLLRAGACLQEMTNCGDWWWGDYLVAFAEFRLKAEHDAKTLNAMEESDQERLRCHYIRNHATVLNGRELPEIQIRRYRVSKFYQSVRRRTELLNSHHQEAMEGSGGDTAVAESWLDKAVENQWTRNELRAEIRAAKRSLVVDPPQSVTVTQHELFGAQRWARAQIPRIDSMERNEMSAMLADLQPILALATALAARLGPAPGVGKESIGGVPPQR